MARVPARRCGVPSVRARHSHCILDLSSAYHCFCVAYGMDASLRTISTHRAEGCSLLRHMRSVRPVANAGHAVGWTIFISSVALAIYGVTRNRPTFRKFTRFWAEVLAAGWGMQVRAHGIAQLDPRRPYVFMANHLSHVDIVALFVALPI